MRVLVTGCAGFLGQHVMKALDAKGHEAVGVDLAYGFDITRVADWRGLSPIDAVIHLAAMAAPRECDADPPRAFNVNVNGTLQVLKKAIECDVKKFIFSSSAHVYGVGPRYWPTDETHTLNLGNTYTTTKILGEDLCHLYFENHGLSYTVLRLFNAYGPGQSPGYFMVDMISKAKTGKLFLTGANTTKDFVYVTDVARAFVAAVETPFVGKINIGSGVEYTLGDVASRIAKHYGAEFSCAPEDHSGSRMRADIARAKRILGWEPSVNLEEGLAETFAEAPALL